MLWGSELSPFALKVGALCDFAGLRPRWLPAQGSAREILGFDRRRRRLARGGLPLTWPEPGPLAELPLVPFLFGPGGENLYDSSAIAIWLDRHPPGAGGAAPLLPDEDPALRFAVRLVDEALDELGLYLVHHNRWILLDLVGKRAKARTEDQPDGGLVCCASTNERGCRINLNYRYPFICHVVSLLQTEPIYDRADWLFFPQTLRW